MVDPEIVRKYLEAGGMWPPVEPLSEEADALEQEKAFRKWLSELDPATVPTLLLAFRNGWIARGKR